MPIRTTKKMKTKRIKTKEEWKKFLDSIVKKINDTWKNFIEGTGIHDGKRFVSK